MINLYGVMIIMLIILYLFLLFVQIFLNLFYFTKAFTTVVKKIFSKITYIRYWWNMLAIGNKTWQTGHSVLVWIGLSSGHSNFVRVWVQFELSSVRVKFELIEFGFGSDWVRFGLASGEPSSGQVRFRISWSLGRVNFGWSSLGPVWVRVGSKSVSVGFGYGFESILGRVEIRSC